MNVGAFTRKKNKISRYIWTLLWRQCAVSVQNDGLTSCWLNERSIILSRHSIPFYYAIPTVSYNTDEIEQNVIIKWFQIIRIPVYRYYADIHVCAIVRPVLWLIGMFCTSLYGFQWIVPANLSTNLISILLCSRMKYPRSSRNGTHIQWYRNDWTRG